MTQFTYPSAKFKTITLKAEKNVLTLTVNSISYYAGYPAYVNLEEVEKGYFDIMMYLLFYGLETIDISKTTLTVAGEEKLISYSGGADSTAVLVKYPATPVHIFRYWNNDYEQRQIRAVINASGINISTNFEQIRSLYTGQIGFNVGIGYASMLFPMMPALKANTVYFGVVFDDISFYYADPFKFIASFQNTRTYNVIQTLGKLGIKLQFPMAGYSEVLTTRIADAGHIANYSSCNTSGNSDKCLKCFKCFRKEGIRGHQIDFDKHPELYKTVARIMRKFPLKMASSTIYGIKNAGYTFEKIFDTVDVSFLERINVKAQVFFFEGNKLDEYQWQTEEDLINIQKFVDFINKYRQGFDVRNPHQF